MKEFIKYLPSPPDFRYDWEGLSNSPFADFLKKLALVPQNPAWHGEGDALSHTKMVANGLSKMAEFRSLPTAQRTVVSMAALFHDLGKITNTKVEDGEIRSHGHGRAGEMLTRAFLWKTLGLSGSLERMRLRESICLLVRNHMLPVHILENASPERRLMKLSANGKLTRDFSMELLCMLSEADVRGRIAPDTEALSEKVELCRELARENGCFDTPAAFSDDYTRRAYLSGRNVWPGQTLFNDTWGEVILLSGLPGTGKDTWIHGNLGEMPVVSLDEIRLRLGISPEKTQGKVAQTAMEEAKGYLRRKIPFVWNATNITEDTRAKLVTTFENYGARVKIVYLETEWEENLSRNAGRNAFVPEIVIEGMLSKLQPPMAHEAQTVLWLSV